MLKDLARSILAEIGRRLPPGAHRSLADGLAMRPDRYEVFQSLGHSLDVTGIEVAGDCGLIEGPLADSTIMSAYARMKTWSPRKVEFLAGLFERYGAGSYIDVGANIGLTTIPIARNPAVACKAFEPEPASFHYLTRNVARHCPERNVELYNCALLDRRTTVSFELSDHNLADHRVRTRAAAGDFHEEERPVIEVHAERLDDIVDLSALTAPIAAKIVAQGAEAHVILGGRSVLSAAEAVVVQLYPYVLARTGGEATILTDLLLRHFNEGAIMVADEDKPLDWQSAGRVADRAEELMRRRRRSPYDYYHLFMRK